MLLKCLLCITLFLQEGGSGSLPHARTGEPPRWYEQITGIIAIPAALIGAAYAYLLIHKTRLESRKLELEIIEKSHGLAPSQPSITGESVRTLPAQAVTETLVNRRYSVFLLRFVVLQLTLSIYNGLTAPLNWFSSLALSGLAMVGMSSNISRLITGTQTLASTLIDLGYWLLFLLLGWPLFKDVNQALGIKLSEYSPRALIHSLRTRKSN